MLALETDSAGFIKSRVAIYNNKSNRAYHSNGQQTLIVSL